MLHYIGRWLYVFVYFGDIPETYLKKEIEHLTIALQETLDLRKINRIANKYYRNT